MHSLHASNLQHRLLVKWEVTCMQCWLYTVMLYTGQVCLFLA